MDKIYYINLNRELLRNKYFLSLDIPHEKLQRFEAIDGITHNFSDEELKLFKNGDHINFPLETRRKMMGNQLSHHYILKDMVKNSYNNILICQDDWIFRKDWKEYLNILCNNIPEDAEIINIGLHITATFKLFTPWDLNSKDGEDEKIMSKELVNEYICKLNTKYNPCSLCYIVTLKGAKNLIEYNENCGFTRATDWHYSDYLERKNINYISRKILATTNTIFDSDVWKNTYEKNGVWYAHD